MNQDDNITMQSKILEGLRKSFLKLVETKRKDNEELVFMKEGKIIRIKARDIDTTVL
jgi:hypothetical protein